MARSMKPVIRIWCLPHNQEEERYRLLHQAIVEAAKVNGVSIREEKDLVVLMPQDLMAYGLGQEIFVEVSSERSFDIKMLRPIIESVKGQYPTAFVQGKFNYVNRNETWIIP